MMSLCVGNAKALCIFAGRRIGTGWAVVRAPWMKEFEKEVK
jgi:hypothetical protein